MTFIDFFLIVPPLAQETILWEVDTEAKVDEPFKEYVQQVDVKQLDDLSAEIKKEMNFGVIGYQLFE